MLIPFPATVAAEVGWVTFSVGLGLGTFAGTAVAALRSRLAIRVGIAGRSLASDR